MECTSYSKETLRYRLEEESTFANNINDLKRHSLLLELYSKSQSLVNSCNLIAAEDNSNGKLIASVSTTQNIEVSSFYNDSYSLITDISKH
jgi:hypothetical protein